MVKEEEEPQEWLENQTEKETQNKRRNRKAGKAEGVT
jgi:hypothetical protein